MEDPKQTFQLTSLVTAAPPTAVALGEFRPWEPAVRIIPPS